MIVNSSSLASKPGYKPAQGDTYSLAESLQLGDVHAARSPLALTDERLRLAELRGEVHLREAAF
jgi:hypothetical protein